MPQTKTVNNLSLMEIMNRIAPNGNQAAIVEIMTKENAILQDIPFIEANGGYYHKDTKRTFVPKGQKRRFDEGVGKSSSKTEPVTFPIAMYESYSEVDKAKCDGNPSPKQFRMDEANAHIEGMSQTFADAIFYGNHAFDPDECDGLATICNKLGGTVIDAGGTGSKLTSVYIVQWDRASARGIYPRGSKTAGVTHDDLGEVTLTDEEGKQYQGYRDHFQCHFGLGITDKRRVARIANIPTDGSMKDLNKLIIKALHRMKQSGTNAVIYGNATAFEYLDIEALNKATVGLTDAFGRPVVQFRLGNPIRLCEAILDTEEQVKA